MDYIISVAWEQQARPVVSDEQRKSGHSYNDQFSQDATQALIDSFQLPADYVTSWKEISHEEQSIEKEKGRHAGWDGGWWSGVKLNTYRGKMCPDQSLRLKFPVWFR